MQEQTKGKEGNQVVKDQKERIPLYAAMAFSSVPAHLDPPNWNQQQLHHGQLPTSVVVDAHHQQHQLSPVQPLMAPRLRMANATSGSGGAPGGSSVRPGSMAEQARMAKIPQPEPGLKCPRCDSTNTKFCYFNNYSLSQPRHFCKTCRRYWTLGGALRNVPVGGGCRRNKRSKSSKKHSSSSSSSGTASASATSGASSSSAITPPQLHPPYGSLQSLGCDRYSTIGASRLGFPGLSSSLHPAADYQLGGGFGLDRWRLPPTQQFPFLSPVDAVPPPPPGPSVMSPGSYPFEDAEAGSAEAASLAGQIFASASVTGSAGFITQMDTVKMDDNPPSAATSLPREFLGLGGSMQFWGAGSNDNGAGGDGGNGAGGICVTGGGVPPGGARPDLSAFSSPPSGNIP